MAELLTEAQFSWLCDEVNETHPLECDCEICKAFLAEVEERQQLEVGNAQD